MVGVDSTKSDCLVGIFDCHSELLGSKDAIVVVIVLHFDMVPSAEMLKGLFCFDGVISRC